MLYMLRAAPRQPLEGFRYLWLSLSKLNGQKCGLCSLPPISFYLAHSYVPLYNTPRDHTTSLAFQVTHRDFGSLGC